MASEPGFMDLVEVHERKWGDKQYPGRPSLKALLSAHIAAVWLIDKRFFFTIHETPEQLGELVHQVAIGKIKDLRRLARVFVDQKPTEFRLGVTFVSLGAKQDTRPMSALQRQVSHPGSRVITAEFAKGSLPGRKVNLKPGRQTPIITKEEKSKR